jgi:glycosyltransferase involved in cell wall biosynthesis
MTARSVRPEKCSVFINSVDTQLFHPVQRTRKDGKFIIIYPGTCNWHQGLDLAIRAIGLVKDTIPGIELHFYGLGPTKESLIALSRELRLNGCVRFFDLRPICQMAELLANADLGIVPKRASDFFGNEAFSTKIMEFMSQGVPVVVSRTRIDTYYYDDNVVRFFESENVEALAQAILELARNQDMRERLSKNGREFVARNSWDTKKQEYLHLVDRLCSRS